VSGWISIEPDVPSFTARELRVKELLDIGYHYPVIAAILRITHEEAKDLIYDIKKKEGLMRKATVSEDEKRTMKMMQAEGKTVREIAEATGRGISTVDRIVNDRKAAKINKEFDAAVDQMIETMHSEPEPDPLEDVENADKKSGIAEKKSANAEEWRLPYNVQVAVDRYISDIDEEIAMRAQRISELTQELEEWTAKRSDLVNFKVAYNEKVAAAAEVQYDDITD
jgi:DNA-binding CsgD family transcriptional regulator